MSGDSVFELKYRGYLNYESGVSWGKVCVHHYLVWNHCENQGKAQVLSKNEANVVTGHISVTVRVDEHLRPLGPVE